ncbi:hypothetical protein GCM10010211_03000 [Streptomyces albospinus]|uniref:Uncharacterized protein n=1 Tax=Streptomyces albospinus TaxID=285515 RepID=A0ABQ2UMT5_9ACTN|nr:hypothetical protein GCM10010211_03000 [Streptomyces albospinus]
MSSSRGSSKTLLKARASSADGPDAGGGGQERGNGDRLGREEVRVQVCHASGPAQIRACTGDGGQVRKPLRASGPGRQSAAGQDLALPAEQVEQDSGRGLGDGRGPAGVESGLDWFQRLGEYGPVGAAFTGLLDVLDLPDVYGVVLPSASHLGPKSIAAERQREIARSGVRLMLVRDNATARRTPPRSRRRTSSSAPALDAET